MKEIDMLAMARTNGFRLGNAQDRQGGTGCTVLVFPESAPCAVDVRGGGPASRESELLSPMAAASGIHAILLSGGSAFGLNASAGVMQYLEEQHIGFDTRICKVPLVVESCIYDLGCGDNVRPDAAMGYAACQASESGDFRQGCYGAGTGATVGKLCGPDYMMKSGPAPMPSRSATFRSVPSSPSMPSAMSSTKTARSWPVCAAAMARALPIRGGSCSKKPARRRPSFPARRRDDDQYDYRCRRHQWAVRQGPAEKIAALGSNGLVRTIRPVNTTADGDSLYAASVGSVSAELSLTGTIAAYVVEQAIRRAVRQAESMYGVPACGS